MLRRHRRRAYDNLRPVRTEQLHLFAGDLVRHRKYAVVAAQGSDNGQADAGIAGGGLDDCPSRQQFAFPLRRCDHGQGRAVLDATSGVQVFELRQEMASDTAGGPVQGQQRRLAHQVQKAVGHFHGPSGVGSRTDIDAGGSLQRRVVSKHHEREAGVVDLGGHGESGGSITEDSDESREPGAQLGQGSCRHAGFRQRNDASRPSRQPVRRLRRRHRHQYIYVSNGHRPLSSRLAVPRH